MTCVNEGQEAPIRHFFRGAHAFRVSGLASRQSHFPAGRRKPHPGRVRSFSTVRCDGQVSWADFRRDTTRLEDESTLTIKEANTTGHSNRRLPVHLRLPQ